jgi:hypothetical protein
MLTVFKQDGIELAINTQTGEAFATVSGYARMSGKDKSVISRRLGTVAKEGIKNAEIQTVQGLRTVALIPETLISQWIVKDSPGLATQMLNAGCRLYLYQIAGYKIKVEDAAPTVTPALTSCDRVDKAVQLKESLEFFGIDIKNPRFLQSAQDLVCDILGLGQPALSPTETWLGVAERAEQLGYPVSLVTKHRSQLGKWVKQYDLTRKLEKRLCNGTQREINLYLQCPQLDEAIKEFLDVKVHTTRVR